MQLPPTDDELRDEQPQMISKETIPDMIQNPYFTNVDQKLGPRRALPAWLDHFNAKDIKRLFRCSLSMWIMTVFIYINPIQHEMGEASFLGCIVLWLAPPSGPVLMHLIAAVTVLLGLTSAWAWGVITMKAALATQSDAERQARLAELQEMAASQNTTEPNTFAEVKIFNGFMLDTRVTATYFCMIGLYLYLLARLRVAAPKLRLTQMMGCIVSAVFLTEAPLLPNFDGNIAKTLVLPCAIAEGIALMCSIFIFPVSSTSEALDLMKDLLAPLPTFLDACLLGLKHPSLSMNTEMLTRTTLKLHTTFAQLEPVTTFLPIHFSIGRWGPDDVATLSGSLRRLIVEFIDLLEIHRQAEVYKYKAKQASSLVQDLDNTTTDNRGDVETGRHQMNRQANCYIKSSSLEEIERGKQSLQLFSNHAEHLIEACKESFEAVHEALMQANAFRGTNGHREMLQRHTSILEKLKEQRGSFRVSTSGYFSKQSRHIFEKDTLLGTDSVTGPALTILIMGLLINERLSQLANALEQLHSKIVELETSRTGLRFWLSTRLTSLFGWISSKDYSKDISAADIDEMATARIPTPASAYTHAPATTRAAEDIKSSRAELISMRTPNNRKRSRISQLVLNTAHWLGNSEGAFAIRMVIVSVALSIPAVIRSSAGFYYREKGLWAVVMAQLTLLPYTADVVYGIVVRVFGTIVGGVVGMAAWYIGAGSGPGSPYGEAAIMGVVIVLFMWWRLFASPALMPAGIMMGITAYLVAIYSWIDTHEKPYGDPGKGYEVFWRRLVLVLIGLGGTIVVNTFPKPPSANRHYRRLLSDSLVGIRDQCALLVSHWKDPAPDLRTVAEEEALGAMEILFSISGPIKLTVFEFSSSHFDASTLSEVCELCILMNQNVAQLMIYTTRLSDKERIRIFPSIGAAEEGLITEIMAVLTVTQQALKTGDPLPAVLPTPLFSRATALVRGRIQGGIYNDGQRRGDAIDDEALRKYVVILNTLLQMFAALDELVLVLKRAVGETSNIAILEI